MSNSVGNPQERELYELIGAFNVIGTLKEEVVLRLDEARDDCVREVLDNIISLLDAQSFEYRRRRDNLRENLQHTTVANQ